MISHSLAFLVLSRLALGAVTPTAPGPGEVFTAGSKCSVSWTPDQSGKWKSFSIDLMSGSNSNMTLVTNVAEDLDGTDPALSPFTWTCPEVDPYSAIYFYQFNAAVDKPNPAWTTRFTIASPTEEATAPPHSKQPNGDEVPWGIGAMRSESTVASREKHHDEDSTGMDDSGEDDSSSERSSHDKSDGGTYDVDDSSEEPASATNSGKSDKTGTRTSAEDSGDSGVPEEDEIKTGTKAKSPKSSLKDNSQDSDTLESKDSKTQGSNGFPTSSEAEEAGFENTVLASSRMRTVLSKPTSTPTLAENINAATPALLLPSPTPLSAQPVGCAGGINATSSHCSVPGFTSHAIYTSKLDSRTILVTALLCSFGILYLV